jgi:N-acetylglucosamine-6-phosphate deacetylase
MKTAITAQTMFTPLERVERPVLVMEDGVITAVGQREAVPVPSGAKHVDYPGAVLTPGFIDIHIHGGAGHDVMEGDSAALSAVERLLANHGVTSYFPTTVTAPMAKTLASLEKLGRAVRNGNAGVKELRAKPLGLHLEGPFISTAKCGVHPLADIIPPSLPLLDQFWNAAQCTVKVVTVAPELDGASDFIRECAKRDIVVSLGHSNAETRSALEGVAAGATHATHTFNAMRPLDHREPGILGVVLSDDRVTADIIADGIHVAPETLKLFLKSKGDERAVLITDAISATGMPDGTYKLGNFDVEVSGDRCLVKGKLAGSVLTMDRAIRNIVSLAEWNLQRAVRLATWNPAKVVGIQNKKGSLEAGKHADIAVLSQTGEVIKTIIGGEGI